MVEWADDTRSTILSLPSMGGDQTWATFALCCKGPIKPCAWGVIPTMAKVTTCSGHAISIKRHTRKIAKIVILLGGVWSPLDSWLARKKRNCWGKHTEKVEIYFVSFFFLYTKLLMVLKPLQCILDVWYVLLGCSLTRNLEPIGSFLTGFLIKCDWGHEDCTLIDCTQGLLIPRNIVIHFLFKSTPQGLGLCRAQGSYSVCIW